MSELSQQPYLLRALYEWCVDSGYTPYLTVRVDARSRVPHAFVKEGKIVLNVGSSAVRDLNMDNEWVSFSARFGGVAQTIEVPIANVLSIYARETGEGMGFSSPDTGESTGRDSPVMERAPEIAPDKSGGDQPQIPHTKPQLRIVK